MHLFVDNQGLSNLEENQDEVFSFASTESTVIAMPTVVEDPSTIYGSIIAPSVSYSKVKMQSDDKCWKGYSNYNYLWIITGPMTVVLVVSTLDG